MSDKPNQYNRLLLKLSGEALMGSGDGGIDVATLDRLAAEAKSIVDTGVQLCLVVGGGNIYRGISGSAQGMDRAAADYMGMLATVMNALALQNAITRAGGEARVQSAIPMPTVCEPYTRPRAVRHLEKNRIVIFAAGTGNPYFTTDTAAALRAAEMGCDAIIKATMVDGVYSADPKTNPDATRYERLTYTQVLRDGLGVMDAAAIALARDNEIPIIVLSLRDEGNILRVIQGGGRSSIVEKETSSESAAG